MNKVHKLFSRFLGSVYSSLFVIMDEEFLKSPDLDPDLAEDSFKANLLLAGLIGVFALSTFVAFMLNEGTYLFVDPILKKYWPNCEWVAENKLVTGEIQSSTCKKCNDTPRM